MIPHETIEPFKSTLIAERRIHPSPPRAHAHTHVHDSVFLYHVTSPLSELSELTHHKVYGHARQNPAFAFFFFFFLRLADRRRAYEGLVNPNSEELFSFLFFFLFLSNCQT